MIDTPIRRHDDATRRSARVSDRADRCGPLARAGEQTTPTGPITVVLADDHPAVLDAVGRMLETQGMEILARASDGPRALEAVERHRPDVAIVDLRMPRVSGLDVVKRAAEKTKVCVYTGDRERSLLLDVVAMGARGIVLKDSPLTDLLEAVHALVGGHAYFDPVLADVLVSRESGEAAPLSDRERSVLGLLADGYRNDSIGTALHIAPDTVRAHIRNAMRKLGANTRTQAVAVAIRRDLID
jgi:DNA-binding NarL/FixJ family response regulator